MLRMEEPTVHKKLSDYGNKAMIVQLLTAKSDVVTVTSTQLRLSVQLAATLLPWWHLMLTGWPQDSTLPTSKEAGLPRARRSMGCPSTSRTITTATSCG